MSEKGWSKVKKLGESPETLNAIWFSPFSIFFGVLWSYFFIKILEALGGKITSGYFIDISLTVLVFYIGFGIYQHALLKLGRHPNHFIRHSLWCLAGWISMIIFIVVGVNPLIRSTGALSVLFPDFTGIIFLSLLVTIWMFLSWAAVFYSRVVPYIEIRIGERLNFKRIDLDS